MRAEVVGLRCEIPYRTVALITRPLALEYTKENAVNEFTSRSLADAPDAKRSSDYIAEQSDNDPAYSTYLIAVLTQDSKCLSQISEREN